MSTLNAPNGDETNVAVVAETDTICSPCPNRIENTCLTEEKISVLDKAHAAALNIQAGDTITWGEAKKAIAEHISLEVFHEICATCSWKSYGICENVVRKLQDKTTETR